MSTKRLSMVVLGLAVLALVGCGGASGPVQPLDQSGPVTVTGDEPTGYPAFPDGSTEVSPVRRTSDDDYVVNGNGFVSEIGSLNRPGPGNSFVLVSSNNQLAWAWYSVEGLTGDRPVSISFDVEAAELTEGDGEFLPLHYWVGVTDYTHRSWKFFGGYTAAETVTINSAEIQERFVDSTGMLHFAVVVPPTGNAGGNIAVQVNTSTVTTAPGYLQNKPHYFTIDNIWAGDPPGHGPSALSPEQHVHIEWTDIAPFGAWDEQNAADTCTIYRRHYSDGQWVQIGTATASDEAYIDPADNDPGVGEPIPGEVYTYGIRAANEAGTTPFMSRTMLVPLIPPADLSATDGDHEDKIVLSWTKAEGATNYLVYRGISTGPPVATLGDVNTWEDDGISPHVEYTYWIRSVRNVEVSELSLSETGYASTLLPPLDPPADVSATDGDHADKVTLTWTKATNATGYDIYRDDTSGAAYASVGNVDEWDDSGVNPGTVYTYWVRSLATGYSSDLSESDSGYAGVLPDNPDLVHFPQEFYPDADYLSIIHADPVVRRNPKIYYDPVGGSLCPEDETAYGDVLKTNGYYFNVQVSEGLWPRTVVVETADPADIVDIGDGLPGIISLMPNTHRLTVDIAVLTTQGNPGDPDLTYSFKVFNSDGTSSGSGTFIVHMTGSASSIPTGIDWAINVWNREDGEIADREYIYRSLNGATIAIDAPTPDVIWFEFADGWYFDWETDSNGVYGIPPLDDASIAIRFENTVTAESMYGGIDPAIAGIGAEGAVIVFHSPTNLSFKNEGFPGWPGIFESGKTYSVALDDPHFPGIEYVYPQLLLVTGPNPNDL